jgi:hypothetical protein
MAEYIRDDLVLCFSSSHLSASSKAILTHLICFEASLKRDLNHFEMTKLPKADSLPRQPCRSASVQKYMMRPITLAAAAK